MISPASESATRDAVEEVTPAASHPCVGRDSLRARRRRARRNRRRRIGIVAAVAVGRGDRSHRRLHARRAPKLCGPGAAGRQGRRGIDLRAQQGGGVRRGRAPRGHAGEIAAAGPRRRQTPLRRSVTPRRQHRRAGDGAGGDRRRSHRQSASQLFGNRAPAPAPRSCPPARRSTTRAASKASSTAGRRRPSTARSKAGSASTARTSCRSNRTSGPGSCATARARTPGDARRTRATGRHPPRGHDPPGAVERAAVAAAARRGQPAARDQVTLVTGKNDRCR